MTSPASAAVPGRAPEPFDALRAYHALAPWSLRDLAALTGTVLEASGVVPVNSAARARPSERTIRYYVAKGLVEAPDGRGTAAVYRYRHFLQVLAIKLRQMEGASLETIGREFADGTGDAMERRVAQALGTGLPLPEDLGRLDTPLPARGRAGRALRVRADGDGSEEVRSVLVRRVRVAPGAELALDATHPLFRHVGTDGTVARDVAEALDALVGRLDG